MEDGPQRLDPPQAPPSLEAEVPKVAFKFFGKAEAELAKVKLELAAALLELSVLRKREHTEKSMRGRQAAEDGDAARAARGVERAHERAVAVAVEDVQRRLDSTAAECLKQGCVYRYQRKLAMSLAKKIEERDEEIATRDEELAAARAELLELSNNMGLTLLGVAAEKDRATGRPTSEAPPRRRTQRGS